MSVLGLPPRGRADAFRPATLQRRCVAFVHWHGPPPGRWADRRRGGVGGRYTTGTVADEAVLPLPDLEVQYGVAVADQTEHGGQQIGRGITSSAGESVRTAEASSINDRLQDGTRTADKPYAAGGPLHEPHTESVLQRGDRTGHGLARSSWRAAASPGVQVLRDGGRREDPHPLCLGPVFTAAQTLYAGKKMRGLAHQEASRGGWGRPGVQAGTTLRPNPFRGQKKGVWVFTGGLGNHPGWKAKVTTLFHTTPWIANRHTAAPSQASRS